MTLLSFKLTIGIIVEHSLLKCILYSQFQPTTGPWDSAKWPHLKSRLEMLDGEVRFVKELHPLGTDSPATFLQKIGNKVFYYRFVLSPNLSKFRFVFIEIAQNRRKR